MGPAVFGMGGRTGEEIMRKKDLKGQLAIITGAKSGIGLEMARLMALAGADVIMAVRKQASGEHAAAKVRESLPSYLPHGQLIVRQCDLSSFAEIRAFAATLQQERRTIDYLVLNAAVKATPKWYTKEGIELQMGVNFIGHFHLVQLLLPSLRLQQSPCRIVAVTCKSEIDGSLRMTDLNFSKVHYDPWKAYKGSKVALALFARELAHRTQDSNISVMAADPGMTGDTMINKFGGPLMLMYAFSKPFLKSLSQAVATPLFACVAPEAPQGPSRKRASFRGGSSGIPSGSLVSDCKVVTTNKVMHSAHMARRVWEEAEQMVDRSVVGSHVANAGFERSGNDTSLWVMKYVLRPMFDFLLRMFGLRQY